MNLKPAENLPKMSYELEPISTVNVEKEVISKTVD